MDRTFDDYKKLVDEHLLDFLPNVDNKSISLYESMKYSLTAGGKRLRPVLLLAACEFAGGNVYDAIPYACALEYIHTYSLIHDDLPCMDNDTLRRGRPTNHVVYGESVALLSGCALYDRALQTVLEFGDTYGLSEKQQLSSLKVLCRASGVDGILGGQILDIKNSNVAVDRAYLERVNDLKTAALLSASCVLGGIAASADPVDLDAAWEYGNAIGHAFQIRDDILDVISTSEALGKTPGKDSGENKTTFVDLLGMDGAQREVELLSERALAILDRYPSPEFLKELTVRMCGRET